MLGRGTFGMVIKADFRGTPVAVKRVLPPAPNPPKKPRRISVVTKSSKEQAVDIEELFSSDEFALGDDTEDDGSRSFRSTDEVNTNGRSSLHCCRKSSFATSIRSLGSFGMNSGTTSTRKDHSQMKSEFIAEMSLLSKLRHPSITTVMGAVVANGTEPMMIMVCLDSFAVLHMKLDSYIPFPFLPFRNLWTLAPLRTF